MSTLAEIGKAELAMRVHAARSADRIEEGLRRLERLGCELNAAELRLRDIAAELRTVAGLS